LELLERLGDSMLGQPAAKPLVAARHQPAVGWPPVAPAQMRPMMEAHGGDEGLAAVEVEVEIPATLAAKLLRRVLDTHHIGEKAEILRSVDDEQCLVLIECPGASNPNSGDTAPHSGESFVPVVRNHCLRVCSSEARQLTIGQAVPRLAVVARRTDTN
jgi:hypothetical protein